MVAGASAMATTPPLAVGSTNGCSSVPATATAAATVPSNPQGSGTTAGNLPAHPQGSGSEIGPTRTRSSENRRSNKPIMEKRRRARINSCLNDLKSLILEAMKKDPARHSKLEKADILEMTVKHLQNLQRQQTASDPSVFNKFQAGFRECAGEVNKFPGLDGPLKKRLLQHLANYLNNSSSTTQPSQGSQSTERHSPKTVTQQPVQVHILRTPDTSVIQGLQLVPTRLPNGDIALILPAQRAPPVSSPSPSLSSSSSGSSPLPSLVPIPHRTVATSPSPVAFDRLSVNPAPRQVTVLSTVPPPPPVPRREASPIVRDEPEEPHQRLVINEDYEDHPHQYGDQETLLHIPERDYYEDSYGESESEFYPAQCYSPDPMPLALVTRKRCDDNEDQPWRPW